MNTTRDINGDGIIDQWGITSEGTTMLGRAIIYSNLGVIVENVSQPNMPVQYAYSLQSREAMKAVQFFSDLYNTYKVVINDSKNEKFMNGLAVMNVASHYKGKNWKSQGMTDLGFVQMPFGPDNPEGKIATPVGGGHTFFFPSNIADPEAVVNAVAYWHTFVENDSRSEYITNNDKLISSVVAASYTQKDTDSYMNVLLKPLKIDYVQYFSQIDSLVNKNVFAAASTVNTSAASEIESIRLQSADIINQILAE
jgi:hypothetical protein